MCLLNWQNYMDLVGIVMTELWEIQTILSCPIEPHTCYKVQSSEFKWKFKLTTSKPSSTFKSPSFQLKL